MNDKKTIVRFMRYMKQKKAWAAFKTNITDMGLQDGVSKWLYKAHGCVNVPFYLKKCPPLYYLTRSFSWELSPQGYEYWSKIDTDWDGELCSKLTST